MASAAVLSMLPSCLDAHAGIIDTSVHDAGNFVVVAVFMKKRMPNGKPIHDDAMYMAHQELRDHLPRNYFFVLERATNKLVYVSHGSYKFFGQEDDDTSGSDVAIKPSTYLPGFTAETSTPTSVLLTEKMNGKSTTMAFFVHGDETYCLITSKTTATVIPTTAFADRSTIAKYVPEGNNVLTGIAEALYDMATGPATTTPFAEVMKYGISTGTTFMMEYCDGKHLVKLPPGQPAYLAFTVLITIDQHVHDVSKSIMNPEVNGMDWRMWMQSISMPTLHISNARLYTWAEWVSLDTLNMPWPFGGDGANVFEGYVAVFLNNVGRPVALCKLKNIVYILIRMLREQLKNATNPDTLAKSVFRRLNKTDAYPPTHPDDREAIVNVCHQITTWFLEYAKTSGIKPAEFFDYKGKHYTGMAEILDAFTRVHPDVSFTTAPKNAGKPYDTTTLAPLPAFLAPKLAAHTGLPAAASASMHAAIVEHALPIISNCESGHTSFSVLNTGTTWSFYCFPHPGGAAPEMPTLILFRGSQGCGKSTVAECFRKAVGTDFVDIHTTDTFFDDKPFDPKLLNYAHLRNAVHTFTSMYDPSKKYVVVANTCIDLADAYRYTGFAEQAGANVVFWEISVTHGDAIQICAERGQHVNDPEMISKSFARLKKPIPMPIPGRNTFSTIPSGKVRTTNWISIDLPELDDNRHVTLAYFKLPREFFTPDVFRYSRMHADNPISIPVTLGMHRSFTAVNGSTIACYEVAAMVLPESISYTIKVNPHVTMEATGCFAPVDSNRLFPSDMPSIDLTPTITAGEHTGKTFMGFIKFN